MSESIGIEYVPWVYDVLPDKIWIVTPDGWHVAECIDEDVARHIVECHNEDLKTRAGAYPND